VVEIRLAWEIAEGDTVTSLIVTAPDGGTIDQGPIGVGDLTRLIQNTDLMGITGYMPGPYTVTLSVVGADGTLYTPQAFFTVVSTCTIREGGAEVFGRPEEPEGVLILGAGEQVAPLGQALDPAWLRIAYAGGTEEGWVNRATLDCSPIENLEAVQLEEITPGS
jgi:hypothetical protein